jgi:hypothetical protein
MSQINVTTIRNRTGGPPSLDKGAVVTGIITATTGKFTGNVTIDGDLGVAGTMTYDDVTRIDSVGIVTAGGGLYVGRTEGTGTGIGATVHTTGNAVFAGIVTATSFENADGSSVGISAGKAVGLAAFLG